MGGMIVGSLGVLLVVACVLMVLEEVEEKVKGIDFKGDYGEKMGELMMMGKYREEGLGMVVEYVKSGGE